MKKNYKQIIKNCKGINREFLPTKKEIKKIKNKKIKVKIKNTLLE